jgi:hypothetical protein
MTNAMINKSTPKKDNLSEDDKKLLDKLKEDEEPVGEIDE